MEVAVAMVGLMGPPRHHHICCLWRPHIAINRRRWWRRQRLRLRLRILLLLLVVDSRVPAQQVSYWDDKLCLPVCICLSVCICVFANMISRWFLGIWRKSLAIFYCILFCVLMGRVYTYYGIHTCVCVRVGELLLIWPPWLAVKWESVVVRRARLTA